MELGPMEGSRSVNTPVKREKITKEGERKLDREGSKVYRGLAAAPTYPAKDRSNIVYAAKEVGKDMAKPTQACRTRTKRIHR